MSRRPIEPIMTTRQQHRVGLASLALLGLAFIAALMASNTLLSGLRIDLTENDLYTIAPGTRGLLTRIDEPINLYFFFSDRETADIPYLRGYATRVREMLEEFEAASDGNLIVHSIDPLPFSEEQDRAAQFGLDAVSLGSLGESIYFGLAGTNSVGDEDTIGFFQPEKETFLEYDLAKLIYNLANPDKTVVGLIAGVSMTAGFDPRTQQMTEPWTIVSQARQLFEVRNLAASLESIDEDVDLLWIVHPKNLDQSTLYAIDQFILGGGRALIFVDPLAEIDMANAMDPASMAAQGSSSDLPALFDAWGVEFSGGDVVGDNRYALSISAGFGQRPVRHLGLIGAGQGSMDADDVITAGLGTINLGTAGYFRTREDSAAQLQPLLTSSTEAAPMSAAQFMFLSDPQTLLDGFSPTGETYVLAARLTGPLNTAFPDGRPAPSAEGAEDEQSGETTDSGADHRSSAESANVILVSDVDILSDRLWVQVQNFLGQRLATAFANNGDFLINALDNLSGSAELIGIRARASYSRPFTTVDALRREADAEFRQTEQRLQAELAETEQRLSELQAARTDEGSLLMSDEQRAEIQRFLDQQVSIRRELRAVQRNLDRSIEQLGTALKVINIGLMPVLLTVVTLLVVVLRRGKGRGKA
jgi:ABC-type uncharacterized transport system involved in gliding motility auxiliary subunit